MVLSARFERATVEFLVEASSICNGLRPMDASHSAAFNP
jgi:hypothetical protein